MKLLNKELLEKIPPLYSTENIPLEEKIIVCKFFSTTNDWSWYVVEGEYSEEQNDFVFFGLVDGFEREWGYFTLSELKSLRINGKPIVERDLFFSPIKVKNCKELKRKQKAL